MITYISIFRLTVDRDAHRQTLGRMIAIRNNTEVLNCKTLELPWLNNQKKISCIPKGKYHVVKRTSQKYGNHFYVQNVPNRDMILIHAGNYVTQTEGCILVGDSFTDINGDNLRDVTNSKATLAKLYDLMPDEFELYID